MTGWQILWRALFFVGIVWLYTANFTGNIFKLGEPNNPAQWRARVFESFQMDSEMSATLMLEKTKRDGLWSSGGFMMNRDLKVVYDKAFGLNGKIMCLVYKYSDADLNTFVGKAHGVVAFLFAVTLGVFALYIWHEFGFTAALVSVIMTNLSDWLVFVARNLFYFPFLHYLPFILSLALYPVFARYRRFGFAIYAAIITFAVLVNSLGCTVYITNIIMSVGIGPLYYGIVSGHRFNTICKQMAIVMGLAILAVAVALCLTGVQGNLYYKSSEGFRILFDSIYFRMFGVGDNLARSAPPELSIFRIFEQYLPIPLVSLPFSDVSRYRIYFSVYSFLFMIFPCAILAFIDARLCPRIARERVKLVGLTAVTIWAMLASLSWAFLLKGHMWHHPHMNALIFYLPYLLFLFILLGKELELIILQIRDFIPDKYARE